MDTQWQLYLQQLDQYLRDRFSRQDAAMGWLEQKLVKLEQENARLIEQLGQVRPIKVDAINYKVQELSVKELSGTLNVGLSALADPEAVAKWIGDADKPAEGVVLSDLEKSASSDESSINHESSAISE